MNDPEEFTLLPLLEHLSSDLTPRTLPETYASYSVEGLHLKVRRTETGWQASVIGPVCATQCEAQRFAEDLASLAKAVGVGRLVWQRV